MKKIALVCILSLFLGCGIRVRNYDQKQFLAKYDETIDEYDEILGEYITPKEINRLEKNFTFLKVQLQSKKLNQPFVHKYGKEIDNYLQVVEDLKD